MKNVTMTVKDNILTITVNLDLEFGASKSLKNTIIATTGGKVGLNVYK
mgnify:CR=1 FL=1